MTTRSTARMNDIVVRPCKLRNFASVIALRRPSWANRDHFPKTSDNFYKGKISSGGVMKIKKWKTTPSMDTKSATNGTFGISNSFHSWNHRVSPRNNIRNRIAWVKQQQKQQNKRKMLYIIAFSTASSRLNNKAAIQNITNSLQFNNMKWRRYVTNKQTTNY